MYLSISAPEAAFQDMLAARGKVLVLLPQGVTDLLPELWVQFIDGRIDNSLECVFASLLVEHLELVNLLLSRIIDQSSELKLQLQEMCAHLFTPTTAFDYQFRGHDLEFLLGLIVGMLNLL